MGGTCKSSYQPLTLQRYYSATKSNKTTIPTGDYRPTKVLQCDKVKQNHNTNRGLSPYRGITVQQSQTKPQYHQGTIALQRYYSATKSNKTTIPTGDYRPTEVLQCNKVKQNHNTNRGLSPYKGITVQQSQTKPQYQQGTIALQRYYSATKSNKTTIPTGDYRPTEVLQCNKVKQNHNTNRRLSP